MHVWKRTAAYLNATFHFFSWDYKRKLMTSQVRALYTWCVTSYNDKPIDLCFTIYRIERAFKRGCDSRG